MKKRIQPRFKSLLAWREAHGLNQRDAADHLGITQGAYQKAEVGLVTPRRVALKRIVAITGVPVEVLARIA